MQMNQRIVLASRPKGAVTPDNFRLESVALPSLNDGEVLVRNHYMSLDPDRCCIGHVVSLHKCRPFDLPAAGLLMLDPAPMVCQLR